MCSLKSRTTAGRVLVESKITTPRSRAPFSERWVNRSCSLPSKAEIGALSSDEFKAFHKVFLASICTFRNSLQLIRPVLQALTTATSEYRNPLLHNCLQMPPSAIEPPPLINRDELTKRAIPHMVLGDGSSTSLTAPPNFIADLSPLQSAEARFSVTGNAIVREGTGTLGMAASMALLQHGLQSLMLFDVNVEQAQKKINILQTEFPNSRIERGALMLQMTLLFKQPWWRPPKFSAQWISYSTLQVWWDALMLWICPLHNGDAFSKSTPQARSYAHKPQLDKW
jgi:hypothetical protein